MINITPLEEWIRQKTRIRPGLKGGLFADALKGYQLQRLNEVIDYARSNTRFYRRHLDGLASSPLSALSDIAAIPFTTSADLAGDPFSLAAVDQDDIARIVTLRTSGSTGASKRLFFTEQDLELTIDFFHHGMSTLVRPGQRVAILLPGELPDTVGDLLARGLSRMDVRSLKYGPVLNPIRAAEAIASFGVHCLVGIPSQVLAMARSQPGASIGKGRIENVLLSTDYVPDAIAMALKDTWGCRVFNHYGMTEMGLGGGVECDALDGYHLREADLYFEIINNETGEACPDGTIGEVVFTTLTREGMPLIRYRTGDIARFIPQPCPCGSVLRRMGRIRGRWDGVVPIGHDCILTLPEMDEALFRLDTLLDYRATITAEKNGHFRLRLDVHQVQGSARNDHEILQALNQVGAIRKAVAQSNLDIPTVNFSGDGPWTTTGTAKRKIFVIDEHIPYKSGSHR